MSDDNVVQLIQPGSFSDPLTEALRNGARSLLAQAVEAEVAAFLAKAYRSQDRRWPQPHRASRASAGGRS